MQRSALTLRVGLRSVAVLCVAVSMAFSKELKATEDVADYARKVEIVDRLAGEVVAAKAFIYDEEFIKLASEGSRNIDGCIQFLSEDGHSPQQRLIAILAMYKLDLGEYLVFLRKLKGLLDKRLVSSFEMIRGVSPMFSAVIVENYGDKDVQSLLKELEKSDNAPASLKKYIRSVLSGEVLRSRQGRRPF
jgi:hypothetical protein